MRNIFDQFKQPENRLTHALACCLHHDRNLLKSFLVDLLGIQPSTNELFIVEQSLPGKFNNTANISKDNFGTGLPDMIIFDEEGWCVIIESKVMSPICDDQIKRHYTTLKRRGFSDLHCVVIAVEIDPELSKNFLGCTWSKVYGWVYKHSKESFWAKELKDFFEILERNMTDEGYLTMGTITDFIGIPFTEQNPYSYIEGKRILKLMMDRLKQRKKFDPTLDIDYEGNCRSAITKQSVVWDILPFKISDKDKFVEAPHFTFGLTEENLQVMLTFPDKLNKSTLSLSNDVVDALVNMVKSLDQFQIDACCFAPTNEAYSENIVTYR